MNSKRLEELIKSKHGSVRRMCAIEGLRYTTIMTAMETDEKLDRMKVGPFMAIARSLDMSVEELAEELGYGR